MNRSYIAAAAFAIALGSTAVLATAHDRGGPEGPRADMLMERLDMNEDGQITRDEAEAAAAARFAAADGDGDGKLTEAELAAAHEARIAERRARAVGRMIARHDADGDGALSLDEMTMRDDGADRLERLFRRLDADDDGVITQAELDEMGGGHRPRGHHRRHGHGDD